VQWLLNLSGQQYVYGFRVPMLVVSAYTPAGYISGDIRTQTETPPYVHDFGSILNFIEYAFGTGGAPLGGTTGIDDKSYAYADIMAPDAVPSCVSTSVCPFGLSDFFGGFKTKRSSPPFIYGAKYSTNCFINSTAPG